MTRPAVMAVAALATLPAAAGASDLRVSTGDPQSITSTAATLRADVDHALDGGEVTWQYGLTKSYGATTLPASLVAQDRSQRVTLPLRCLAAATTYHVRAVATSGLTTVYGDDRAFETAAAVPGATAAPECTSPSRSNPGAPGTTTTTTTPAGGTATTSTPATTTTEPHAPAGTTAGGPDADGSGATTAPGVATAKLTPALGRSVALAAVRGTVTATAPSGRPVDLTSAHVVPVGTVIDARAGTVELKAALDAGADRVQVARFWAGRFEIRQDTRHKGLTQIVLRGGDFSSCAAAPRAVASSTAATRKRKPRRALWGSDSHGQFQTRGRGSVATVRGTRWLTEDRCDGTLTRVTAGAVAVRDVRRKRTVVVTKGHDYLARVAP